MKKSSRIWTSESKKRDFSKTLPRFGHQNHVFLLKQALYESSGPENWWIRHRISLRSYWSRSCHLKGSKIHGNCRQCEISENSKYAKSCFFGLNEAHMRAQDLKIGGFGTEFRDEAIGIGLRTQKYITNKEKQIKRFFPL